MSTTDNYKKHTTKSFLQRILIGRFFSTLINEVAVLQPDTVLDVGCGEGFTLQRLKNNNIGKHLEGVDFLDTAVKIGQKIHPTLHLKQGNIYNLPYKDKSFDVVMCTEVLEHLEEPEKALKELARISKKYCIISVPHEPWFMLGNFLRGKNISRWGNDIEHIQHWTSGGIKKLVGKYFTVLDVKKPLPWTLLVAKKR